MNESQQEKLNKFRYSLLDKLNNSSRNLIVVAPTGVGKTTTVLSYIAMNPNKRFLYVSPLKVLCEEVQKKLLTFNTPSDLIIGDTWIEAPEAKHRVIVSTYEKADSMIRRGYKWLNPDVIIIDEFHNITSREAIESIILYAMTEKKRVILLSATVSNIDDIAKWLNAEVVRSEERVVPLYKGILYGHTLYGDIPEKYVKTLLDNPLKFALLGKTIMVFVKSRWKAVSYYKNLPLVYKDMAVVFHGGLEAPRRKEVIDSVMSGKKKIIITTTALGQGVNLPVWMVIFEDTVLPLVKDGQLIGWRPLSLSEFNQIAGRAGRPDFDTEGIALIIAESEEDFEMKKLYLSNSVSVVNRSLSLEDYLLITIHRKRPTHRELIEYGKYHTDDESEIERAIAFLVSKGLVKNSNSRYETTEIGKALVLAYVNIEDGMQLAQILSVLKKQKLKLLDLLKILSTNQKVVSASRGVNVFGVLYNWINGYLVDINASFTPNDLDNLVNTARWIANAMYRIAKAFGMETEVFEELVKRLDYGVPKELFPLYEAVKSRKQVLQLASWGMKSVEDVCKNRSKSEEIIGFEKLKELCLNSN